MEVGLKAAVMPDGRPLAARLTDPANPFTGATATVNVADAFSATFLMGGVGASVNSAAAVPEQFVSARNTFSRPPVVVFPNRAGTKSTAFRRFAFRAAVFRLQADKTSAAAPDTIGVAIDVPLRYRYVFGG